MKPSLLFLPISLLPGIMAWYLTILVPETWKETARVWGKKTSEGGRVEQSRASDKPGTGAECPLSDDCDTSYFGITGIEFSKPTADPRPINITMGGELLQCEITSPPNGDTDGEYSGGMWWFVDWGWKDSDGFKDGRITCRRGPDNGQQGKLQ